MRTRTKGNLTPVADRLGYHVDYYSNGTTRRVPYNSSTYVPKCETTVDEIHPNFPHSGGPFWSRKISSTFSDGDGITGVKYVIPGTSNPVGSTYEGAYRITNSSPYVSLPSDKRATAEGYGAEAYAKFSPTKPLVGLGQFFYELKETPRLFAIQLKKFKDLGNNYLNAQFGWRPFLSDLRSWYSSLKQLDQRIAHLRKQNGQGVSKGGILFNDTTSDIVLPVYPSLGPFNYCSNSQSRGETKKHTTCWFKGKYRYYIPGLDDERWGKLKAIQMLYGLDITPSLLWELMPFSWLIDWCSNAGDVIQNLQSAVAENLTTRYAYVMLHEESTTSIFASAMGTYTQKFSTSGTPFPIQASGQFVSDQKIRVEASPFGFGLSWDNFNLYQLSILAALGISKFKS